MRLPKGSDEGLQGGQDSVDTYDDPTTDIVSASADFVSVVTSYLGCYMRGSHDLHVHFVISTSGRELLPVDEFCARLHVRSPGQLHGSDVVGSAPNRQNWVGKHCGEQDELAVLVGVLHGTEGVQKVDSSGSTGSGASLAEVVGLLPLDDCNCASGHPLGSGIECFTLSRVRLRGRIFRENREGSLVLSIAWRQSNGDMVQGGSHVEKEITVDDTQARVRLLGDVEDKAPSSRVTITWANEFGPVGVLTDVVGEQALDVTQVLLCASDFQTPRGLTHA